MVRRNSWIIGLVLLAFTWACESENTGQVKTVERAEPQFRSEGVLQFLDSSGALLSELEIEFADDQYEITQGMMWRKSMKENRGMLFIFTDEEERGFWMKNCYVSLDMIFIDGEQRVVSIRKNTPILSTASQESIYPARYVVEVNAGYADRHGIAPGVKMTFQRN